MGAREGEGGSFEATTGRARISPEVLMEMFEHSHATVMLGTLDDRILFVNPAGCASFETSEDELRRLGLAFVADLEDGAWREALAERSRHGWVRATVPMKRKDGSSFLAETESAIFTGPDDRPLAWFRLRDITDRVRLERRLVAYDEVAEALLARREIAEVLGLVAHHARLLLDAREAAIAVPSEAGDDLVVMAADGPGMSRLIGRSIPPPSLGHETTATGRSSVVDDLTKAARSAFGRELGLGPALVLPIVSDGRLFGILWVGSPAGSHPYSETDLAEARRLADRSGVVLGLGRTRSELELTQKRLTEQLERALESRVVIEQAKGIISAQRQISVDQAFERLRKHARDHDADIHRVATAVVSLGLRL